MTTLDALLAAIRDRPHDDTPRLVMADYLDGIAGSIDCPAGCDGGTVYTDAQYTRSGRPGVGYPGGVVCRVCAGRGWVSDGAAERAEFIRIQCELARLVCPDCRPEFPCRAGGGCRKGPLSRRAESLFDAFGLQAERNAVFGLPENWLTTNDSREKPSPGRLWPVVAVVRRGFLDEWRGPLASWAGGPCPLCEFDRRQGHDDGPDPACPDCRGTGDMPGVGAEVVRRHPVTAVRPSDAAPNTASIVGRASWYFHDGTAREHPHWLPASLIAAFREAAPGADWYRHWDDRRRWAVVEFLDGPDAATRALSAALILLARRSPPGWVGAESRRTPGAARESPYGG